MNRFIKIIAFNFFLLVIIVNFASASKRDIVHINCNETFSVIVNKNFERNSN